MHGSFLFTTFHSRFLFLQQEIWLLQPDGGRSGVRRVPPRPWLSELMFPEGRALSPDHHCSLSLQLLRLSSISSQQHTAAELTSLPSPACIYFVAFLPIPASSLVVHSLIQTLSEPRAPTESAIRWPHIHTGKRPPADSVVQVID